MNLLMCEYKSKRVRRTKIMKLRRTPFKHFRYAMKRRTLASLSACVVMLAITASSWAQIAPAKTKSTFYTQTNLVTSGKPLKGNVRDKNLLNPWGLVQGPTPFWVSDNNAGVSTLYQGNGKKVPLVVTIPPPKNSNA